MIQPAAFHLSFERRRLRRHRAGCWRALAAHFGPGGTAQQIRVPVATPGTRRIARPGVAVLIGIDEKPRYLIRGKLKVVAFKGACDHQHMPGGEWGKVVEFSHVLLPSVGARRHPARWRKIYDVARKVRPQDVTSAVQTRLEAACADRRIERSFIVLIRRATLRRDGGLSENLRCRNGDVELTGANFFESAAMRARWRARRDQRCGSRGTVRNRIDAASCNWGAIGFPRARLDVFCGCRAGESDGDNRG